jgi:hypothetical protein
MTPWKLCFNGAYVGFYFGLSEENNLIELEISKAALVERRNKVWDWFCLKSIARQAKTHTQPDALTLSEKYNFTQKRAFR